MKELIDMVDPTYQMLCSIVGTVCVFAYVCRLNDLKWGVHKRSVLLWNEAQLAGSAGAVYFGATNSAGWMAAVVLLVAGGWLFISWPTWRDGPPHHTETGAMPFEHVEHRS